MNIKYIKSLLMVLVCALTLTTSEICVDKVVAQPVVTKNVSEKLNYKSAVITFDPHPSLLFNKDTHYLMTDFDTKKEMIKNSRKRRRNG